MEADDLQNARDLVQQTKELEKYYDVDYLFSNSNRESSYNLKSRLINVEYKEIKDKPISKFSIFCLLATALVFLILI